MHTTIVDRFRVSSKYVGKEASDSWGSPAEIARKVPSSVDCGFYLVFVESHLTTRFFTARPTVLYESAKLLRVRSLLRMYGTGTTVIFQISLFDTREYVNI